MLRFRALMIALVLLTLAIFGLLQVPFVIVQAAGGYTVTPSSAAPNADATSQPQPTLLIAPSSGAGGTLHLIYAENLPPLTDYQLRVYLEDTAAPVFETDVTSSNSGVISLNYQTDAQTSPGRYGVEISDENGVVLSGMFQVTGDAAISTSTPSAETAEPTAEIGTPIGEAVGVINVEPPAGVIGTDHVITVENLTPNEEYLLVVEFDGASVYELPLTSDENGTVGTLLYAEASDPVGEYTLRLLDSSGAEIATGLWTVAEEGDEQTPVAPQDTPAGETAEPTDEAAATDEAATDATTGQRFEGQLDDETPSASFEFDGTAGQVISIRMTSAEFDAYLLLADADENVLMRNDNSGGDFNAEINGYVLPADGTYTIVATSRQNLENGGRASVTGNFVVTLNFAREAASGAVASGETIIGQFEAGGDIPTYTFSGEAGQLVTIDLASDAFDPFVILVAPNGQQVVSDDDSGPSLYARVDAYELTESGDYTIQVDGFRGPTGQREISGEYRLTLIVADEASAVFQPTGTPQPDVVEPTTAPDEGTPSEEGTPTSPDATPSGDAAIITYGQPFEGELMTDAQTAEVQFEGSAGDVVDITLDSDAFDPNVTVLAPDGSEIGSDDDSGPGVNVLITGLELPESGTYTIVINGYRGAGGDREISGTFTLTVNSGDGTTGPAATATPGEATPSDATPSTDATATLESAIPGTDLGAIASSEALSGTLNNDVQSAQYRFEANAGDVVTIDLSSTDFDPYVRLLDANGTVIAEDDDSGGDSQAQISAFVIPAAGEYFIEIDAFRGFSGMDMVFGDYTVTLNIEAGAAPPAPTTTPTLTGTPTPLDTPVSTDAPDLSATPAQSGTATLAPDMGGTMTGTPTPTADAFVPTNTPAPSYLTPLPDYYMDGYWPALPVNPFTLPATPLTADQPVDVTFTGQENEAYAFTFEGVAGTNLSVFTVSGETLIDTAIVLYGPDGYSYPLLRDDDSGAGDNPEITWLPLYQTGQYRLIVLPYIPGTTGSLGVYYTTFEPISLVPDGGEVEVSVADKRALLPASFDGVEGQQLRLTIRDLPVNPNTASISLVQNGQQIATVSVGGGDSFTVNFTVPQTGEVLVQFSYQGIGGSRLYVSLEPVE